MTVISRIRDCQRHLLDTVVRYHPMLGLDSRAEKFVQLFEKNLPENSLALDIGGGWGFYNDPLVRRGHHLTILDVVKPGYQKAPVVIYEPGSPFPFPDKSFDVSFLVTVLHHISDPESVLREAMRVTRKKLIVIEDLYHHPVGRLWTQFRDQLLNFEFFGHPGQFRTKEEWLEAFSIAGFKLVDAKEVYTWLSGLRILNGIFILDV
ncbi:MAG: class I SAM-dependent methyltransferase [Candidatus Omnitrophica bacterium]|nr:class I SAM-dependent methyltransferase [Candidatus Omnitrophota bacterium]